MPVIKVNNVQHSLHPGQNRLGWGDDADVRLNGGGNAALGIQAIVDVSNSAQAVIRRVEPGGAAAGTTGAAVRVNGISLVDPTPLMHGDKVEIDGYELLFADDTKSGNTTHVSSADIAALVQKRSGPARATTATGGRLVSLVDGKEYSVPGGGITIGRDAGADIVVAEDDVSRKHAVVAPVENGYEVRDFSANGVFVNGTRIDTVQLLSRADVIRLGSEEFRFYADVRPWATAGAPAPPAADSMRATAVPTHPSEPDQPDQSGQPTSQPPTPLAPADSRPVLAVLEVTSSGPANGLQFLVQVPLAHIGCGAHNDIVISDETVSDMHARLQRRDDGWYLVDVGSTNGTYVGDQRIKGECKLEGAPAVRFGGVAMTFRANDPPAGSGVRSGEAASADRPNLRPTMHAMSPSPRISAPVASTAPPETPERQGLPVWVWSVVVLAIVAAVAFFLLNR